MRVPFPLRSNPAPFKFMGEPRAINCFAQDVGREQKSPVAWLSIPGQSVFSEPSENPCRGLIHIEEHGKLFSLHLSQINEIDSAGTATANAVAIPGSDAVFMARNSALAKTSAVTITIASPAVVTWTNHGLKADDPVVFSTSGTLPTGITAGTTYYVISTDLSTNTFKFSETAGGAAVNTSGSQTGTHSGRFTSSTIVQIGVLSNSTLFVIESRSGDTANIYYVETPETFNSIAVLGERLIGTTSSGRFFWSATGNMRSLNSLNYATAEALPDGLVRAFVDRKELLLFGKVSTEIKVLSGDDELPFTDLSGTFIDKGLLAAHSPATVDNAVCWVANDETVRRMRGYSPVKISTQGVEDAIEALTQAQKEAIRGYSYSHRGHEFYVLTCSQWTWVYDAATGEWAERKSYQRNDWRAWPCVRAFGKDIVGDKASGDLLSLEDSVYRENGRPIICELYLPDVSAFPEKLIFDRLDIEMLTGAGLNVASTADGYNPEVMLRWSDDGGYEWSSWDTAETGIQGAYDTEIAFTRMGQCRGRGRRYHIAYSEPTQRGFQLADIRTRKAA